MALLPALLIGAHLDGIRGAAIAHVIVAVLVTVPLFLTTLHRARIDLGAVGRRLVRPALGVLAVIGGHSLSARTRPSPRYLVRAERRERGRRVRNEHNRYGELVAVRVNPLTGKNRNSYAPGVCGVVTVHVRVVTPVPTYV